MKTKRKHRKSRVNMINKSRKKMLIRGSTFLTKILSLFDCLFNKSYAYK